MITIIKMDCINSVSIIIYIKEEIDRGEGVGRLSNVIVDKESGDFGTVSTAGGVGGSDWILLFGLLQKSG